MARRYDPYDPNQPYDPYREDEDEGGGYLNALNAQLGPQGHAYEESRTALPDMRSAVPQGTHVPETAPAPAAPESGGSGSRDQALAQVSNTYSNASQQINAQNPTADAGLPYVQQGDTGGYLDGTGVTLRAGSSKTQAQADQDIAAARNAGLPEDFIQSFIARNGMTDTGRLVDAYNSQTTGSLPDSNPGGGGGSGAGGGGGVSGGGGGAGGGGAAPGATTEPSGIRAILMDLLGKLDDPVTADDPMLAGQLASNRLASQRTFDRDRAAAAERRAYQGLGDSGAMETDIRGLEEGRAERDLAFEGDAIRDESQDRRDALMQMLGVGVQDTQFTEARQQQAAQFAERLGFDYASLSQQDRQFIDQLAYAYNALEVSGDNGALRALLELL